MSLREVGAVVLAAVSVVSVTLASEPLASATERAFARSPDER